MSKITTVIKVMEQMRKEDNGRMHIKGELTSGDEVMFTIDKDVDRGHKSRRSRGDKFEGHGSHDQRGHHQGERPNDERLMEKFQKIGFTQEEIDALKTSKNVLKNSRPKPKDRMIMGLKMLDRMEESSQGDTKQLTMTFTKEDMPAHMKETRQAMKIHGTFAEKLRLKAKESGHDELIKLADHMDHGHSRPHMEEVKKALADKGIDFHDMDFEKGHVIATIDKSSNVTRVVWTAELKDKQGQILTFKGEGIPA